ncbi:MAG TPA: hypothetical protein VGD06_05240 [Acidobacteriota bacterium]
MAGINGAKVIIGGLVAGLVYNVLDIVNGMLLMGEDFRANAVRLGIDPAAMESTANMAVWISIDFVFGILVVFTYAAIRPRFGAGPKTAAYAGIILYAAVTLIMLGLTQEQLLTWPMFWKMAVVQLVVAIVGAVSGAAVYKEA